MFKVKNKDTRTTPDNVVLEPFFNFEEVFVHCVAIIGFLSNLT